MPIGVIQGWLAGPIQDPEALRSALGPGAPAHFRERSAGMTVPIRISANPGVALASGVRHCITLNSAALDDGLA